MFYPNATWRAGPSEKRGYPGVTTNAARGVVCHSMVGYLAGAMARLDSADRASWHFSVLQNGTVLQHYNTADVTWHCGSREWNQKLIGIEHEGGYDPVDEPLTVPQRDASVTLVRWLAREHGFPLERQVSLWEHHEIAPPSDPTACPSGRIPWEFYTTEETDMPLTDQDKRDIGEIVKLQLELFKQELEASGQIRPPK